MVRSRHGMHIGSLFPRIASPRHASSSCTPGSWIQPRRNSAISKGCWTTTNCHWRSAAHLASLCVPLLLDRSNDEAIAMVEGGLKLYPLPALLQWEYYLVAKQGTPTERIRGLLGLLKCNPSQPLVVDAIVRELAAAGMPEDSAEWFSMEFSIAQRMGVPNDEQFFVNLGSELFLAGQTQAARQWTAKALGVDGGNVDLWFCC